MGEFKMLVTLYFQTLSHQNFVLYIFMICIHIHHHLLSFEYFVVLSCVINLSDDVK